MTDNQQPIPNRQDVANEAVQHGRNATDRDASPPSAMRNGDLKTQAQRYVFRFSQWMHRPDGFVSHYKNWLSSSWEKWLGLGAGITGILMLVDPDAFWRWQFPLLLLIIFLSPLLFAFYRGLKEFFSGHPGQYFIGEIITLDQAIVDGMGSIHLQKENWLLSGPDCTAGTRVKIIAFDDKKLYVALAD